MDLTIDVEDYKLNVRATVIIEHNGKILVHRNVNSNHYALMGGRVKIGEDSETTVKREVMEELGKKIEVIGYVTTIENFFEMKGSKYHEILFVHKAEFADEEDKKIEYTLKNIEESTQDENFKDKASSTFISIVDFLFYDGTIKGISFDELTEKGKEKVLEISSKIDVKLEEKCPGYKEKISNSTSKAYQKASKIIKKGAKNINDFAKSALGDENYQAIIDAKDELAKYSKEALNYVTGAGSKVFNNTKEKLNEWYQNFKNK